MSSPKSIFTAPESFTKQPKAIDPPRNASSRRASQQDIFYEKGDGLVVGPNSKGALLRRRPSENLRDQEAWNVPSTTAETSSERSKPQSPVTPATGQKRSADIPRIQSLSPEFEASAKTYSEPRTKKPRITPRPRHSLDHFSFPGPSTNRFQPPSPLFFSNSPSPRPHLPARFSSSEAAARMLRQTKGEEGGLKNVHLARGSVPVSTPSTMSARASVERSSIPRSSSPDIASAEDGSHALAQVGIIELLEQDDRPTFVVDLKNVVNYGNGPLTIPFANAALRAYTHLYDIISGQNGDDSSSNHSESVTFPQFKSWLLGATQQGESLEACLPSISFSNITWSCSTLRRRLRVVSGTIPSAPVLVHPTQVQAANSRTDAPANGKLNEDLPSGGSVRNDPPDYFGDATSVQMDTGEKSPNRRMLPPKSTTPLPPRMQGIASPRTGPATSSILISPTSEIPSIEHPPALISEDVAGHVYDPSCFDWTRLPLSDALPRHIKFAKTIEWEKTSLGPIEHWSSDLRQMCNLIMASPHPAAMYWGPDFIAIYNEAYIPLAGKKHPELMGSKYSDAWTEIWDEVKDVFWNAQNLGEATMKDDDCLFVNRNDFLEETYFSWSIIPMIGEDATVQGLYNPAFEKTRRKVAERRMLTLREVGERTATARDVKSFWQQVLAALEKNPLDTPFALLYSVADEMDSDTSSMHSNSLMTGKQCYLEGTLGVPPGHVSAPPTIDLKTGMEGFGPVFRETVKTGKAAVLDIGSGDLPNELLEGIEYRGFGDPCRAVVVCPIHPTTGEGTLGFLAVGINPRRPYDDDYSLFVQLLSRQLATSLASVVLFEEEIKRGQKAAKLAALDRMELSEQLAARTQEAIESETKFTRMAEFAPVGMFIANSEGHITFCNETWYDITRVPRGHYSTDRWINSVKEEDQAKVRDLWRETVSGLKSTTAEFRFKSPWEDRNGNRGDTWALFSAYPEKYDGGTLKSVFGSITNISQQKWAEGFQKRKMEEAVELKRQQENFIDITSHEMRNPLSAILQCADEISTSLSDLCARRQQDLVEPELLDSSIDAAQTIALCAQHQKRIVDDILTLSKLDSALLLVTPIDVQPLLVVQRALRMFEGELQTADIEMKFVVDPSYKDLDVDWVRFDPSRVLQVLINLITNAVKFTTTQRRRVIIVSLAASLKPPSPSTTDGGNKGPMQARDVNYFPIRSSRSDPTLGNDWGNGQQLWLHFAVQDTGRGLTPEEKKLLFMRFSQVSPRTHVQYGGSGLGLFISRELTELQGGSIGVSSEAGRGSTFAFYIKVRRGVMPEKDEEEKTSGKRNQWANVPKQVTRSADVSGKATPTKGTSHVQSSSNGFADMTASSSSTSLPKPLNVLVVEDNLVNQRVLQKQLKNLGCNVIVANHGGECLDTLKESSFWKHNSANAPKLDCVLMDQEMPVMDGLTCTKKIRELEQEGQLVGHVPIIAVTANARSEQIQTAMAAGMDDVVSKPFRIPELMPKIEELVARYQNMATTSQHTAVSTA